MEHEEVVVSKDKKLTFRKYASIENSYLDKFIESIINQGHTDNNAQWVALEKSKSLTCNLINFIFIIFLFLNYKLMELIMVVLVHGANFSFITNGEEIHCAKRSGFVEPGEEFHNHHLLLENYRERILKVYASLKEMYPELHEIAIYGEIFGGKRRW